MKKLIITPFQSPLRERLISICTEHSSQDKNVCEACSNCGYRMICHVN